MSRKHPKYGNQQVQAPPSYVPQATTENIAEYTVIKHDLVRVVVLNAIYLAIILAVYYTNSKSHYLENWFAKVLHF